MSLNSTSRMILTLRTTRTTGPFRRASKGIHEPLQASKRDKPTTARMMRLMKAMSVASTAPVSTTRLYTIIKQCRQLDMASRMFELMTTAPKASVEAGGLLRLSPLTRPIVRRAHRLRQQIRDKSTTPLPKNTKRHLGLQNIQARLPIE